VVVEVFYADRGPIPSLQKVEYPLGVLNYFRLLDCFFDRRPSFP
jgi:hypothetical protein